MRVQIPALVAGCAVVLFAAFMWRNREAVAELTSEGQQALFGDASRRVQRTATGKTMGIVAIGFGAMGVAAIVLAIFAGPSFD